ncbi:hypothetical protein [Acinetobacter guillouiae]|uniref:hypothetical protein n=1 Tax=Acinetobacter guillouiae TaxID=106649 RepID=UPI001CD48BB9|nr:hypothetical protein [Acinetobacter guillouiae]
MKNTKNSFQFQRITIVSQEEKSGLVLKLYPKTLITTNENTVGKSTLLNCLFWGLGCEVKFEEDWKLLDISTLVEFSINNNFFKVKRNNENIYFFDIDQNSWIKYDKITGDYLEKLNEILNFNILLKNKNAVKLSRVPPAFYFSSTYIEQMNGWNEIWNSFKNLGQFSKSDKQEISKYLCGVFDDSYYENKRQLNEYEIENKKISQEIVESLSVIDYFDKYNNDTFSPIEDFKDSAKRLLETEKNLQNHKQKYISDSSRLSSVNNEIDIVLISIGELEHDYIYSVENIENTSIYCPTCGVEHHNNLVNRFSIINDIDKLKTNLDDLKKEKISLEHKINNLSIEVENISNDLNNQFYLNNSRNILNNFLLNNNIKPSIDQRIDDFNESIKYNNKDINLIKKNNRKISNNNLANLEEELVEYFNKLCEELKIRMFEKNKLNEILDYYGGGANQIKAMLAKRLTILKALSTQSEIAIPPFVVDSLRQQDVDDSNYEKMLHTLITETPDYVQLIVAAVQNEFTNAIKGDFEEIFIEGQLLSKEDFALANFMLNDDGSTLHSIH